MKVVVSKKPKEYLQQGKGHCGVYTIKAILNAYNKDLNKDPKDYHIHWYERQFGFMLPWSVMKVLKLHKLQAILSSGRNLSADQKLFLLKKLLSNDTPIAISIGNGYLPNGEYNEKQVKTLYHWVTLWGYNDNTQEFYVYDSCVPKEYYDTIPIGNKKRSYTEIIRDWNAGIKPWFLRNLYIHIQ